ncbi:DUF2065 domain-containing protein [Luteithermobacter gelatinilyticus]|uniref:DUF2065 domain-containing protein n=1 Tax=Luteithermobacter gelatinilyticus TaxID=2582913 RepID=UPI0011066FE8|nr:DUF2065 domain-containing protein [Luteithermobacter gelatinilyticus]|tara:strand:+ start:37477 stop:37659 length:183 start_codon:yes stop_codon:yes gene_type:complete
MNDLLMALGLVLVIEGILYALFPEQMRRMMRAALELSEMSLRISGLVAVILGIGIIYAMK